MRLSASTLNLWMQCPLQVKFRKVDHLPTRQNGKASWGTCIHHALEMYNTTGDIELAKKDFLLNWNEPERLNAKPDYWPKYSSFGKLKAQGLEVLEQYHDKQKWETRTIIAQEHHFLVPFGEHELHGYVDLVELRRAGNGRLSLDIVDYKGHAKAPNLATLRFNIQFTVYVYASLQPEFWYGNGDDFPGIPDGDKWFEDMRDVQRRAVWYHLMTNKAINAGERDDGDFMRLYRLVNEVNKAVEADVYVPDISADTCVYCDFTKECGIQIVDRESVEIL